MFACFQLRFFPYLNKILVLTRFQFALFVVRKWRWSLPFTEWFKVFLIKYSVFGGSFKSCESAWRFSDCISSDGYNV